MQLIEQLRVLGTETENAIPELNSGGCCVYAAAVAKRLQRLGVPVWGVASDQYRRANVNVARLRNKPKTMSEWNSAGVGFNHVLIQFVHDGKIWTHDSGTTTDDKLSSDPNFGYPLSEGNLTVGELTALAASDGWSHWFDRESGVPVIHNNIAKHLSKRALQGAAP